MAYLFLLSEDGDVATPSAPRLDADLDPDGTGEAAKATKEFAPGHRPYIVHSCTNLKGEFSIN